MFSWYNSYVKHVKKIKYKNLILLLSGIVLAALLSQFGPFLLLLLNLKEMGLVGALFGGILFVYIFTVTTGGVILVSLSETLSPLSIALVGGLGGLRSAYKQ